MTNCERDLIKSNISLLVGNVVKMHEALTEWNLDTNCGRIWIAQADLLEDLAETHAELAASDWHRIEKLLGEE